MEWSEVVSQAIDVLGEVLPLLIGGAIAVVTNAITERRADRRTSIQRSVDAEALVEQRRHDRVTRGEDETRVRVRDLLRHYQERISARLSYVEMGEDSRGDWIGRTSEDFVTAVLIPDSGSRDALATVVEYIGDMSRTYHGRAILGPHETYGDALYEAMLTGRDVCAQWLREGTIEASTAARAQELRDRHTAWLPESGGPGPASAEDVAAAEATTEDA